MDYEEAYFKDIMPEIGSQVLEAGETSFRTEAISEEFGRYSEDEVEDILTYIADREDIRHLEIEDGEYHFLAFEADMWNQVDEELEEVEERTKTDLPDVKETVSQLSAQEYGKLRNNLGEVYEGLRDVKDQRTSYFNAGDIKERVNNVRAPEVGLVLSGLAAAGLVKKYRGRNDYEPDSIDTERIEEFKQAIEDIESFEDFKELVREGEKE